MQSEYCHVLINLEEYDEACELFSAFKSMNDAVLIDYCRAIEGRQRLIELKLLKSAETNQSSINAKQKLLKEIEIHSACVLPKDLEDIYERILKLPPSKETAICRCKFISALFETSRNEKGIISRLFELLKDGINEIETEEDWRVFEIMILLDCAENLDEYTVNQIREEYLKRFTFRHLAVLLTTIKKKGLFLIGYKLQFISLIKITDLTVQDCNSALLKEPRFIDGWLALIKLYAESFQWKYVDVAVTKARENLKLLAQKTGLLKKF